MTTETLEINGTELKKDDHIVLKRGSIVYSTHPSKSKRILTKKQTVKFHHTYSDKKDVVWSGSACYWNWTAKENVEEIIKQN